MSVLEVRRTRFVVDEICNRLISAGTEWFAHRILGCDQRTELLLKIIPCLGHQLWQGG
jgi:hypothetical protein